MDIRGLHPASPLARAIEEIIDHWALQAGVTYELTGDGALQLEAASEFEIVPRWAAFLLTFDVDYRKRRLHFLIEGQNRLYQMLGAKELADLDAAAVDRLKRKFYECIEALERREAATSINAATHALVDDVFGTAPSPTELREIASYARSFVERHKGRIDLLIERLGADIDLRASTQDIDILLAKTDGWPRDALHEVLVNYLGFPFWDVLTFPVLPWREAGEFNEIRVNRISAQDAGAVARLGAFHLKGAAFGQAAAFLSRTYRENDYLLGRLHAADRLIDIVCDAAGTGTLDQAAIAVFKRKAFLRILEVEEQHLRTCGTMFEELRAALEEEQAPPRR